MREGTEEVTGLQKAAILMVLLGDEASSTIYQHLGETEIQRVTGQIAALSNVSPEVASEVLTEYQDRKSTRLNSSHPSISYAVFCLKKKTNQPRIRSYAKTSR